MTKAEKAKSLAYIDYEIAQIEKQIKSLQEDKQRAAKDLNDVKDRKKKRMQVFQTDINKTKSPHQKKHKRAGKIKESKTYDNQIKDRKNAIEKIKSKILKMQTDIKGWKLKKAQVRLIQVVK